MASKVPIITFYNGDKIPQLGFGTWQAKEDESRIAVENAIKAGYRHIDTAFVYQNEKEVGTGIKNMIDQGVVKREDVYVVTKLWNIFHDPSKVRDAFMKSLNNLGLEYVDLYLIHFPGRFVYENNGETLFPKGEDGKAKCEKSDHIAIWNELEKLVQEKKIRSLGVSNFDTKQIQNIIDNCTIKPVTNQVECNAYLPQRDMKAFLDKHKMYITAYAPLSSPRSPFRKENDPVLLEEDVVKKIASVHKKTPAQVLIKWLLQSGIIAIPKSSNAERIKQNFDVFDFKLTDEQMKAIDGLESKNGRQFLFEEFDKSPDFPEFPERK